ncbi:MAG: ABC transporter substrate-binding protein [Anaerolineae bacterium]|jgi:putative ABC transport system substrate-binding protein
MFENRIRNWQTLLVGAVVFTLLLSGCCAKEPKVYRVGILSGLDFFVDTADGFKDKMTELGYVEGENITYDLQKTNFDPEAEQRILEKFIADEVDLIVVFPTEVVLAAKSATQGTDIPVLFAQAFTEGVDLVESLREPGGNITGVRYPGPDLAVKALEILVEVAPQAERVWVPYLQGYPSVPGQLEAMRSAAASLGVTLVEVPVTSTADLEADLQARAQSDDLGIDAMMTIYEPVATWPDAAAVITKFAVEHQLPLGNQSAFRIVVDNVAVGKQAAPLADKILKGTPAGTIPVVSAEPILKIEYTAALEQGLTVPEELLHRADVIER